MILLRNAKSDMYEAACLGVPVVADKFQYKLFGQKARESRSEPPYSSDKFL